MSADPCLLCGRPAQGVRRPDLPGVTSDCRPWPRCVPVWTCPSCGLVQKAVDATWRRDVEAIYADYALYPLSLGREQLVFEDRAPAARSRVLLEALARTGLLPPRGAMLDFGCGNGSLFRQFREVFPGWRTAGLEQAARLLEEADSANHPDALFIGGCDAIAGEYDLVSMVHVLEHLPDPAAVLAGLRQRLAPGGLLVLLSPNILRNPFDLAIVDHRFHLSLETARLLLAQAGFEAVAVLEGPAKELALAARPTEGEAVCAAGLTPVDQARALEDGLGWLESLARQALDLAAEGGVGVFGTAIGGVWLAQVLGERVDFFVDEDPDRRGKSLLGRKVLAPEQTPPGSRVCLPLPLPQARAVGERLARMYPGRSFLLPPEEKQYAA